MTRLFKVLGVLVLIVAAFAVSQRPLLNAAGRWLIVQDPIERADVIVILAGGPGDERVRQAAALFHQGYAPRVLLSGGEETYLSIPASDILRRQALAHGIPAGALAYETGSTSTYEQAQKLSAQLDETGVRRAIVVTSPYHTRRTRYLFRKAFAGTPVDVRIFPVQDSTFHSDEWWTRDADTERVVLEYIKLILALFH